MSQTILERIASGDASAVDDCLSQYGGLVWSLARRFHAGHADAEDAVQEIFIEIWRNAARFDARVAAESTFITMIARRRLIDRYRKHKRTIDTSPVDEQQIVSSAEQTDHVEMREEVARAREAMRQLRPEERQVLELSVDRSMSQSQIAEFTKLPLGTVKTHARRGMLRLRQLLEITPVASTHGETS